jgi:CBS domain-containing protein
MRVDAIMSRRVETCRPEDTLAQAAQKMWEHDIGSLPVIGADGRVTSMITDRDIAMDAFIKGKKLTDLKVGEAMSRRLASVQPTDDVRVAQDRMCTEQVHRLPGVNPLGFLKGVVRVNDLAHHLRNLSAMEGLDPAEVAATVSAISSPRSGPSARAVA